MGYPVAMKAQTALLSHNSDAGGVPLNLADGAADLNPVTLHPQGQGVLALDALVVR